MRKIYLLLFTVISVIVTLNSNGQNVTVNPGAGSYPTLKAAFDAINAGTHTGAITVSIDVSTTEGTTPATLNSSGAGAASYTSVLIYPSADGIVVSGNPATGFGVIQLKGADNVTIDGDNPNTGGTNRNLTVNNTNTTTAIAGSVIRIATAATVVTSADNITIKNCNLNGNVTAGNASAITSTTGSSNSSFGIYCGGNGGATATDAPTAITSVTTNSAPSGTTINNLTIDNNAVNQCARGIVFIGAAASVSPGTLTISNNVVGAAGVQVGNPPYTSPSTTVYTKGIYLAGLTTASVTGNTLQNVMSYVGTTITGIEFNTAIGAGLLTVTGNSLTTIVNNGTSSCLAISLLSSSSGTYNISNNNLSGVWAAGSSCSGINCATSATSGLISLNNISTVRSRTTGGQFARGIVVSSGNAVTIQNNFISDVLNIGNASFSNSFNADGILLSGGINHKVYHNTVNLFGVSTSTGSNSINCFAISASSQTGIDVRNNIFSNTVTGGAATDAHTCVFLPFTVSASMLLNLNNNAYYTGSVAASGIGFGGATTFAAANLFTVANFNSGSTSPATNWRSISSALGVSASDNVSLGFTSAAPFVSATNLHLNTGVTPTQLESGGATVGVSTDIDGQARPGPAGSVNGGAFAPDMGADEFDGVFLDASPPVIVYTPLTFTCATGARTLVATITDLSGVPTSGAGLPVLYWKINAGAYAPVTAVSLGGNQYQFSFGAGAVLGDVVSYYIVAQDLASTPNIIASPSAGAGGYTINPPAASTPPTTPSSYIISGSLGGTYTVGAGGAYTTLTAAVNAYNTSCLTGPVIFSLTDASYSASETFPIVVNSNSFASSTNTLTIEPASGINSVITGSTTTSIIKLNGADYVTIDGLNAGGSSLSIINTNAAASTVIWIGSSGASDGANSNTVKNCSITGSGSATTIVGIVAGSGTTIGSAGEAPNSNNTIQNNIITKAQNAIYISGNAALDQNWIISSNTLGSSSVVADKLSFRGMFIGNAQNLTINGNLINGVISSTSSSSTMTGIQVGSTINGGNIYNNKISDIKQTNTTGWGSNGIYLAASSTSSNLNVYNNFITDVASQGFNGVTATDNGYGVMVASGGGYNIYYNTILLNTNQVAATGITAAINIASGIGAGAINLQNNILANSQTIGTNRYAILSSSANTVFASINYNDYYAAGPNLGYIVTDRVDLAAIQAGFGSNTKSISFLPAFVSATDLHLVTTPGSNWCLNGSGIVIPGITTDIDANIRSTGIAPSGPDMGADEFTATGLVINNPAAVCSPATIDLTLAAVTAGSMGGLTFTYFTDAAATIAIGTPSAVAVSNTYYIKATNGTCSLVLPVVVTVNPQPTTFNVTGGGGYCTGGSGVAVGLSGSESGVDYQLFLGASPVGSAVAGTGSAFSFGLQTTAGSYSVVATNATSFCTNNMTGSVTVSINPLPIVFNVTGGGAYCSGGTGVAVSIDGSETGVDYQLFLGASPVGSAVAGTGSALSFGLQTAAGTYTVVATNATTTCFNNMTGSVAVSINPVPVISSAIIQPTSCVSTDGSIDITMSGAAGPYTFTWSTLDGSGLVAGQEDQSGLTVGQYTLIVSAANSCTATVTLNLPGPGGCAVCPTIGALTTNPVSVACLNSTVTLTASGLTSMGVSYGINFKVSPTPLADPYVGGSIIGTVPNAGLTGGGTIATTTTVAATAGSYYMYAVLSPVPLDPACRPSTVINVVVNPEPTVNPIANQIVCDNGSTTAVTFSGAVPGTIFDWTNDNTSIGLAASGTGNIASFTATNATNAPVTSTVTVTPSTITVGGPVTQTFSYTGSMQTFTVPAGVTSITIEAYGAEGGSGAAGNSVGGPTLGGPGGKGTKASGTLAVTPGQVLNLFVGGAGAAPTAGYNGGGTGGNANSGGGGGASDVRFPGAVETDRILVAAGGGGGGRGGCESSNLINGGSGGDGDANGANGTDAPTSGGVAGAGGGGTLVAGGLAGIGCGGFLGQPGQVGLATGIGGNGGAGQSCCCFSFGSVPGGGGGGGGYFGGGGGGGGSAGTPGCSGNDKGAGGGGAGGSSYIGGVSSGTTNTGVQSGNGSIVISYLLAPTITCTGTPTTFTYTVNPTPDAVATPASQTVCSANAISTIVLTGNVSGTVFNWTRDNTVAVTGMGASGAGDISGTLTNTTNAPVTVTFTITPTANGCPGTPITATVLVNPKPNAVAAPASQTICSANAISTIVLSGNVSGTVFNWTRDNIASVAGIAASGAGDISGSLTNVTTDPITVTFTIIPTANGCPGTPITATVLVNPTPNAAATPASQTICSAGTITPIVLAGYGSAIVSGTTFNWTRDNTVAVTGIAASGSGNISGSLTNTTNAPVTVTFTITPIANGCPGTPITATVLVNPTPNAVATPSTQTVCTNAAITAIVLSGNVSGTTYNWTRNNTVSVTGIGASGSGNITGTLVNTTTVQQTVTFTITPTANGCPGASITATVIVNPTPTITCPANIVVSSTPGVCGAAVTYPPATATGTPAPTITYSIASGSVFPVGLTTVTATATNACGTVTCNFTVRVNDVQLPVITCPANIVVNTATGTCTATVPYTVTATDNCSGVTTALVSGLASGAAFPMGVTTVTHRATDASGNTATCSFTVTVNDNQVPVISAQPANRTVCTGTNATFSVTATNAVSYQWQSWNGSVWSNITGATGATLTLNNVTSSMGSNSYRVLVNGLCTVVTSNQATLYVNPLPTVSISASPLTSILPGQYTSITAVTSPSGGSFVWYKNNLVVTGTGAVLGPLSIDDIGTYKTVYTDPNGCINTSANLVISGQVSDNMWVYPNPNTGQFNVRFYNQTGETATLKVYDYLGHEVFKQILPQGIAYSNTVVNIPKLAAEVYIVKVVTSNGRELAAERIVVYH